MKRFLAAILAAVFWTGCGADGPNGGVVFNVDLIVATNNPNSFSISGLSTSFSGTRTYSWECDAPQANLAIGSMLTSGSIRLEAFDSKGALVHDNTYEATLIGAVQAITKADGSKGVWMLRFTFTKALFEGAITVTADTSNLPDQISIGGTGALDVSWIFQPGWTSGPVNISVGGMSGGTVRIRLWDGNGTAVFDQTVSGISGTTANPAPSGAAGVWMVQIDYTSAIGVGAVTLSQT
jgi:hypothetical protein